MECTLHLECTWSGVGVYFYWWVIWQSPWSGILVYTYDIRSVVGVYTPVGVVTEWLWSVHSKLECTLRQGKGTAPGLLSQSVSFYLHLYQSVIPSISPSGSVFTEKPHVRVLQNYLGQLCFCVPQIIIFGPVNAVTYHK